MKKYNISLMKYNNTMNYCIDTESGICIQVYYKKADCIRKYGLMANKGVVKGVLVLIRAYIKYYSR